VTPSNFHTNRQKPEQTGLNQYNVSSRGNTHHRAASGWAERTGQQKRLTTARGESLVRGLVQVFYTAVVLETVHSA